MATLDSMLNNASQTGGTLDEMLSSASNGGSLDSLLSNGNAGGINLDAIQQMESSGNNNATSSAGAKGLYQFMPDTAEQYSKRLFGTATRDASTLSPEQQKEVAGAYFSDLMKEFNGNTEEAVAAYNWGQGNVEKAKKKYGDNWLVHAPLETQQYVDKYNRLSQGGNYHSSKPHGKFESFMAGAIGEMNKAGNNIRHLLHMDTEESDKATEEVEKRVKKEEAKAPLATGAGKFAGDVAPMVAAWGAGSAVAAPVAEEIGLGRAGTWLAKNAAGSALSQEVLNGGVTAKDTGYDLLGGAGSELGARYILKPLSEQAVHMFTKLASTHVKNKGLETLTRQYLSYARLQELSKHLEVLRETNPNATISDALAQMGKEVPDVLKSEEAYGDLSELLKDVDENVSHTQLHNFAKSGKEERLSVLEGLAEHDAEARKLMNIARAGNEVNSLAHTVNIPDELIADTLLQKLGKKADEWIGLDLGKAKKLFRSVSASNALREEAATVRKAIGRDNSRINKKLAELGTKSGVSETALRDVLTKQRVLNNKMIQYIDNGLKGRKVNIKEVQTAIKEVQENQFKRKGSNNVTKMFNNLSTKMEALGVTKLQSEKDLVNYLGKRATEAAAVYFLPHKAVVGVMAAASAAGKAARMSKAANLKAVWKLLETEVQSGHMTFEEAYELLENGFKTKAAKVGRTASGLRELSGVGSDNQK